MRDEPEASAPDEATRVDGDASAPSSTPGPGAAAGPRRGAFDDWLKDQVSAMVGPRLGRYTLLRLLGEGGMGVVFAAYDEELDRKVAIKLLRTPSDGHRLDRSVLLREARAMARLDHPNIVQVYDVAEIEDQLFVAMEFVAGVSLRAWLAGERRGWREVVATLIQAGRGLQAAHEAGLVHCDFKPANVLVGKDGRARVLDFGLAQLQGLGARPGERGGSHGSTLTGGTPAYMAPEVYLAGTHDARSDLFAFSVALYEGLYGRRPFAGGTSDELRQAICAGAIATPPAGGAPVHIRDAVLRGLATDAARRWPSMQALLAEIERDPTRVRRRRWIAGGVVAALSVGSFAAWQSYTSAMAAALAACRAPEAEAARLLAPERRAAIRQALVNTGLPYAARGAETVEAALDAFVRDLTATHGAACEDAVIRGAITPDMMHLRDRCAARQLAEVSAAVDVLAGADAAVVDNLGGLVAALPNPARCQDLRVLAALADDGVGTELAPRRESLRAGLARVNVELAAGHFQRAQELVTPLLAEVEGLRDRALRAEILESASACADAHGDPGRAEELELRGFADALAADHVRSAALLAVSRTYRESAILGRLDEAGRWSRIAEGLIERADDDDLRFIHLIHLGGMATARGDHVESLAIYDRALELSGRIRASVSNLWALHNNRGIALNYLGRHAEAIAAYERALALVRETYGDEHPDIATTYLNIATVQSFAGELEAALQALRAAAEMQGRLLGEDHPALVITLQNLATVEQEAGALAEADDHATRAAAILAAAGIEDDLLAGYVASVRGEIARRRGRTELAVEQCTKGLVILERQLGPTHFHLAAPLSCLGEVARARRELDEAAALLERALGLIDVRVDVSHADRGHVRLALARVLATRHEEGRARELADGAIAAFAVAGPSYRRHHADATEWRRSLGDARP